MYSTIPFVLKYYAFCRRDRELLWFISPAERELLQLMARCAPALFQIENFLCPVLLRFKRKRIAPGLLRLRSSKFGPILSVLYTASSRL